MAKLPKITCNIHVVASNCHEKTGKIKCDVIRVSSSVSSIKTKARNRLHTKTVRALVKVKEGVKMSGGCVMFSPPPGAKQRMSNDILYANADSDSEPDTDLYMTWLIGSFVVFCVKS